ncbi:sterol desaturase family protein [Bradyrhizobium sp. STM 3809]|uniref:sterol desaturase family protein n=1 Tax=Bradyrhizobium sp. STM 3809 TaxID=551936 RepID=UPI0002409D15|nr:sterol desaturase family protein [Bradyrhizobium sp. STM 3809]CCE01671.1 putative transmembrane fatty acid synthesis protein precursor [Bradyrhizobium sp. STM 3809]
MRVALDHQSALALSCLALAFIGLEVLYGLLAGHEQAYDPAETLASFGVAAGNAVAKALTSGLAAAPLLLAYRHRLFDIPVGSLWSWLALFVAVEFCYYWFHRASHRIRWLWATHAVHHSATRFNLSAGIRLGWTGQLTGAFLFFLPLAWIGFHPIAITLLLGLGLLYQFFLHTGAAVEFGPLEWVLNTPRHHRAHHAINAACLDKNYGSILIVFDRMFGTFAEAPEGEPLRFGVHGRPPSNNPFRIAFREWIALAQDVRRTQGLVSRLRVLFGPP